MNRRIAIALTCIATVLLCSGAGLASPLPKTRSSPSLPSASPGRSTTKSRTRSVTIDWAGDVALSSDRGLPRGGYRGALAGVAGVLRAADIATVNLEGTLTYGGPSKCGGSGGGNCFAFRAPPPAAYGLRRSGVTLVNQANNHSFDYGSEGRRETLAALRSAGIAHTGLPGEITVRTVRGIRVAFLGFAPYGSTSNLLDVGNAVQMVRRARRMAPLVVVMVHAGAEGASATHTPHGEEYYLGEDRGHVRRFAHVVVDAGASLVVGSGPHVLRGMELYRGHVIAYSLANFVGFNTLSGGGLLDLSGILSVTLDPAGRLIRGRLWSVRLSGGIPFLDRSGASAFYLNRISREDFPLRHLTLGRRGIFAVR